MDYQMEQAEIRGWQLEDEQAVMEAEAVYPYFLAVVGHIEDSGVSFYSFDTEAEANDFAKSSWESGDCRGASVFTINSEEEEEERLNR